MTAAESGRRLFGTDGIRGVANVEPITGETVLRLGRAAAQLCEREGASRPRIVVGRDTRCSGDMLESALAAGICSMGVDVLLCGVLPTPGVACLTRELHADAGVVISASHNPFPDNGLKFFAGDGFKLPDRAEEEIERLALDGNSVPSRPTGAEVGRIIRVADAGDRYKAAVKRVLPSHLRLNGLKIVIDCAHGAGSTVGPAVFEELGADVATIGVTPNGENINHECGALHPLGLQETVRREAAHIGVALDGDADRVILVDEHGELVDGDQMLAMMAAAMLAAGTLRNATVVATVMSNMGLEVALRESGARLVRVQVGDRHVVDEMRRHGYNLGGEQSGHLVLLDHGTTGDGLVAAASIVRLMVERQRPLSELKRVMTQFPQVILSVPVAQRRDLDAMPPVRQMLDRITGALNNRGRVLVRYSGTEPLVRVMVEGERVEEVQQYAEEIAAVIRTQLAT